MVILTLYGLGWNQLLIGEIIKKHSGNKNLLNALQCCLSKAQSTTIGINASPLYVKYLDLGLTSKEILKFGSTLQFSPIQVIIQLIQQFLFLLMAEKRGLERVSRQTNDVVAVKTQRFLHSQEVLGYVAPEISRVVGVHGCAQPKIKHPLQGVLFH